MKTISVKSRLQITFLLLISFVLFSFSNSFAQAPTPRRAVVDFNGDNKTDFAVLRFPGNFPGAQLTWWIQNNGAQPNDFVAMPLGLRGIDVQVPADYDGDGKTDIAVFRHQNTGVGGANQDAGTWYIFQSSTNSYHIEKFGQAGDNATVVDDYDGDGKADLAVYRINTPPQGLGQGYYLYKSSMTGDTVVVPWGMRYGTQADQADEPYTGDFDGDGKADFGVQRRADITDPNISTPAVFYILTATGNVSYEYFGLASDRLVPGDYNGDGKTDICVARDFNVGQNPPLPIKWFIRYRNGQPDDYVEFGTGVNFSFTQGDYDGDGKTDISMFVASRGEFWYRSSANQNTVAVYRWGNSGVSPADLPVANYNNR